MLCGSVALTRTALRPCHLRARYWGGVADGCTVAVTLYFALGLALGWGTRSLGHVVRLFGEFFIPVRAVPPVRGGALLISALTQVFPR